MNEIGNPEALKEALKKARRFLRPPKELLPSEWAEENVKIPIGNAIPGFIRFDNAPYQREPLDMFSRKDVQRITLMWGAQLGKTQLLNCALAYHIAHEPVSQIMLQPSQSDLHTWLETKFNSMVDANQVLKETIAKPRSREGVNNQTMKSYPGGFLMFSWAGSARTLRGRSAPKIYCDETDGYEYTNEGHPVNLLWQRAATFSDQRKLLVTSTPTIKGASFVESSYQDGDQRQYYVPCPHCEEMQTLKWSNVRWDKDDDGNHLPDTAHYVCEGCGSILNDNDKRLALKRGEWRASKPFTGHVSYHLSELYSSFRRWSDIVRSFLEKKANNDIQSFTNVSLAETYDGGGDQIDEMDLAERRESFGELIPDEVIAMFAGVDVQDNRLEVSIIGFGRDDETYVLGHEIMYGDPSTPQLWTALSSILFQTKQTYSGRNIGIRATAIDSGGHFTNSVYQYAKNNAGKRVFAIKGVGGEGKPIVGRPSKNNVARCPLFPVGVDTTKDLLFTRLKIKEPGAGYVHFNDTLNDEYFRQLTAEKIVTKMIRGFAHRQFQKMRPRNEALDCFVYALAAYGITNININALADRVEYEHREEQVVEEKPVNPKKSFVPKTNKGFVNSWR